MQKNTVMLLGLVFFLSAAPRLEVSEDIIDFGNHSYEKPFKLDTAFRLKNSGSDTLEIQRVKPGCSCTDIEYTKKIAPGETGELKSSLAVNHTGYYNKSITVFSNSDTNAILRLYLRANIFSAVTPQQRYMYLMEDTGSYSDTLYIKSNNDSLAVSGVYYRKRKTQESDESIKLPVSYEFSPFPVDPQRVIGALKDYLSVRDTMGNTDGDQRAIRADAHRLLDTGENNMQKLLSLLRREYPAGFTRYQLIFSVYKEIESPEPGQLDIRLKNADRDSLEIPVILQPQKQ